MQQQQRSQRISQAAIAARRQMRVTLRAIRELLKS